MDGGGVGVVRCVSESESEYVLCGYGSYSR